MNKLSILLTTTMLLSFISCGNSKSNNSDESHTPANGSTIKDSISISEIKTEDDDSVNGAVTPENDLQEETATTISSTSKLPALALSFKTNITMMNLTTAQKTKYNKAIAMVKKVVATEAFRKKVLAHTYAGKTQFANNNGKTNSQIYQSILDAAESLKPLKNNTMDLGVKMYYAANSVVGYTSTSITYINVNTKFFNRYATNQVAGNLFHEWLHKIGYSHDSYSTTRRPYSVPYAIGYMVRDIGKSFL